MSEEAEFPVLRPLGGRGGHAVSQWLRHYATNRKVASSIADEVIFLFI
jgi:hypothetical protein